VTLFLKVEQILCAIMCLFIISCRVQTKDEADSLNRGIGFAGQNTPDDIYCPEGYSYDAKFHQCFGRAGVLGPFTDFMIQKCKSFGGGAPCDGLHWEREFAQELRGIATCPMGAQLDSHSGVCADSVNVFGPFMSSMHKLCIEASGGPACETMRWSRKFFEGLLLLKKAERRENNDFESLFPEPHDNEIVDVMSLWATYYRIPIVPDAGYDGIPLLDISGRDLEYSLSPNDWCHAALEGSVRVIKKDGLGTVFNFSGTRQNRLQVDCVPYVGLSDLGYSRFYRAKGPFGDGVNGYLLRPYRTLAVDPSVIPYGSVLYIPSARGTQITLSDGASIIHDGYFFAADTGGAINGNHIDVFIGSADANPLRFVKSAKSGSFKAYLIENEEIRDALKKMHL